MLFDNQKPLEKVNFFTLKGEVKAHCNSALNTSILKEFWYTHSFNASTISFIQVDSLTFSIGTPSSANLSSNEFVLSVQKDGIFATAKDEKALIRAYVTLLDKMKMNDEGEVVIPLGEYSENCQISTRMAHYCVFPDTKIWEVEKFIRLCGAVKYTHIIIEFWGMLQYQSLKELSWKHAFSKEQLKPIINLANNLGMEVIPMFNHWGHATQSRVMHGKHVALDSNLALQYLFSDDGWCWDIKKQTVKNLLKKIRNELIELCGAGSYFHIGCDEAYGFEFTHQNVTAFVEFINEISADLNKQGRRAIMWGDMLLCNHPEVYTENRYTVNAPNKEVEKYMLENISKDVIIADWQYDAKNYPIQTSLLLSDAGFDVIVCPWDRGFMQSDACIETVKKHNLYGIMHTTWHTLSSGMLYVVRTAMCCYDSNASKLPYSKIAITSASALRKAYFVDGDYEKSGWAKYEIGTNT